MADKLYGDQLIDGSIFLSPTGAYINFNVPYSAATGVLGDGYGLRDNEGQIQFKHKGGSWADIGTGGSGGGTVTFSRQFLTMGA